MEGGDGRGVGMEVMYEADLNCAWLCTYSSSGDFWWQMSSH